MCCINSIVWKWLAGVYYLGNLYTKRTKTLSGIWLSIGRDIGQKGNDKRID